MSGHPSSDHLRRQFDFEVCFHFLIGQSRQCRSATYTFKFSAFSLLLWIGLHKFWSAFLFHTNLDYFRKMKSSESSLDDKTQRVVLKPNLENCSLNAYHAINLLYYMNLSIMGTLHLIAGYGTVSST